jgi:putative membrane protein
MGELAEERAQSEAVREYGETLKEDHAKTMAKSVTLAKTMGASVPSEPAPAQKQHYDALAQLSGAEFDAAFVSHMVIAHQEAIAKYSAQASSADSETAELAEETLPTLREHLAKAQALQRGSRAGG